MRMVTWMVLLALPALGGCGKELLVGGQTGEVRAEATDDPSARSAAPAGSPSFSRAGAGSAQGTAEVAVTLELIDLDGRAHTVAERSTGRVRLASADAAPLGAAEIPVGGYVAARLTVSRAVADVTGGLQAGGVSVTGQVTVTIAGQLVVERPIQLVVTERSAATVLVDLNSEVWLAATNPLTRQVPAAAFASALGVRVR